MAAILTWYRDNSMVLSLALSDAVGPLTGAEASGTLRTRAGAQVWAGALAETEVEGTYQAVIDPGAAAVEARMTYDLEVLATKSGHVFRSEETVIAQARRVGDTDGTVP